MSNHQYDPNADECWFYYRSVIDWVNQTFTVYRSIMKGVDWGSLYDQFHDLPLDPQKLEIDIQSLLLDDDVTTLNGIYACVLTREPKNL